MEVDVERTLDYFRMSEKCEELRRVYTQGQLFQFIVRGPKHHYYRSKKNHVIREFSYQARMRLLKFTATIHWGKIMMSVFATFTYPDDVLPRNLDSLNCDRFQIHRAVEIVAGKKVACLWRKEWVPRKSGIHKGLVMPHWHILFFDVSKFPYKEIRLQWKKIIHTRSEPSIKFVRVGNANKAASYIAKYCAKVDAPSNLDNALQDNKTGRHYGYLRKDLIPRHERFWLPQLTHEEAFIVWTEIRRRLPWIDEPNAMSFSLLGELPERIRAFISSIALTPSLLPV